MIRVNRKLKFPTERKIFDVPDPTKFELRVTIKVLKTEKSNGILSFARDNLFTVVHKDDDVEPDDYIREKTVPIDAQDLFNGICNCIYEYYKQLNEGSVEGTSGI